MADRERRDVVVVGASAGGLESLCSLLRALPGDLPATVLVILHLPPVGSGVLPTILGRCSPLPVIVAGTEGSLQPGSVVIPPPDRHLLLVDDRVLTSHGPRENRHRPAIDVLFRSAARACGSRVIGVVLSGTLDDGTSGAQAIARAGGLVLAQDPEEAAYPGMPRSVIEHVTTHAVASAAELGAQIGMLCKEPTEAAAAGPVVEEPIDEIAAIRLDTRALGMQKPPGRPAEFACPECHGALFEIDDGGLLRYRCRVGHAWSSLGLLVEQSQALEDALWMALRSLEEKAVLSRQLADRAKERGSHLVEHSFLEQSEEADRSAGLIRDMLQSIPGGQEAVPVEGSADV